MDSLAHLENHLMLCDAVYDCLLKENSHLRQTQTPPDAAVLEAKTQLIESLKTSINGLKSIHKTSPSEKTLVEKAQQKTLKIFHLLRENEQLIFKIKNS